MEIAIGSLYIISLPLNAFLQEWGIGSPLDQYLSPESNALQTLNSIKKTKGDVVYNMFCGYGYPTFTGSVSTFLLENTIITSLWSLIYFLQSGQFIVFIIPAVNAISAISAILLQTEGDFIVMTDSQEGKGIKDIENHTDKKIYRHASHLDIGILTSIYGGNPKDRYKEDYLNLILTNSILNVENSNTLTAVKMEPDGCYINVQHPIVHIDGSCDDYLIQWMGENDRLRLKYQDYTNINEVVKLKNTDAGVFDYQRIGDVGRGWFSQLYELLIGGANKIKLVAKNAADHETIVKRTYYANGIKYPMDGEKGRNLSSAVVWYEKDKTTGINIKDYAKS